MPRITVIQKIIAILALILAIGIMSMAILHRDFSALEKELTRLIYVAGPLNAASYETEINVNGIGLAVLKYLSTGNSRYREWVEEDHRDFQMHHQTIARLAETPRQRVMSEYIGARYQEFASLGRALMDKRQEQEQIVARVVGQLEQIDDLIERHLDDRLLRAGAHTRESFRRMHNLVAIEAEAAEVGFWLASYRYRPSNESKEKIESKLAAMRSRLPSYRGDNLDAEEKRLGAALHGAVESAETNIGTALLLENDIHDGRERFIGLRVALDEAFDEDLQPLLVQDLEVARTSVARAAEDLRLLSRYLMLFYLLAVGAAAYFLVRAIRPPLRRLIVGTRTIGKGDLSYRIVEPAKDEFGDLATEFNEMVGKLQESTVSRGLLEDSEEKLSQTVTDLRREIAERERAEQQRESMQLELLRSQTMAAMGQLVAGVAHEVRNPLFGISSMLDALDIRFGDSEECQRYLTVLHTEVNRLNKLMVDLLEFGKPSPTEFEIGPLDEVVSEGLHTCALLAERSGVAVIISRQEKPLSLCMSRPRLVQVFQNLLENAVQHSGHGTTVEIEVTTIWEKDRRVAKCVVKDHGPGFNAEDLPRVFEPFFSKRRGGTGLGLSIVQRIVDEHDGKIIAANRPGGGAQMTLWLPLERRATIRSTKRTHHAEKQDSVG